MWTPYRVLLLRAGRDPYNQCGTRARTPAQATSPFVPAITRETLPDLDNTRPIFASKIGKNKQNQHAKQRAGGWARRVTTNYAAPRVMYSSALRSPGAPHYDLHLLARVDGGLGRLLRVPLGRCESLDHGRLERRRNGNRRA